MSDLARRLVIGLTLATAVATTSYSMAESDSRRGSDGPGRGAAPGGQKGPPPRSAANSSGETLKQALSDLDAAKAKLAKVGDLGGHRDKAKAAIDTAIAETKEALAASDTTDRSNPDAPRERGNRRRSE